MNWAHDISAAWSAIGPLVGVLIGAGLTKHIQRRQWLADRKREEYRELLTVLTQGYGEVMELDQRNELSVDAVNQIQIRVVHAVHNRIFTSDEAMVKIDVFKEWSDALQKLRIGDKMEFSTKFGALTEDIRQIALEDIANSGKITRTARKMFRSLLRRQASMK